MFTYTETTLSLNETFIDIGLEYRGSNIGHFLFYFGNI